MAYVLAFQTFSKYHVCQGKIVASIDGNLFLREDNLSLVSGTLFGLKKEIIISGRLQTGVFFQTRITFRFRF